MPRRRVQENLVTTLEPEDEQQLQSRISELAPFPGSLVLFKSNVLRFPDVVMDSLLIQALDMRTGLLIGRCYFVSSLAAKMDFIEHMVRSFPFPVQEIRTDESAEDWHHTEHRFSLLAQRLGLRHSVARFRNEGILAILDREFLDAGAGGKRWKILDEATAELRMFLFDHNNLRPSFPFGKTPVDILRGFLNFPHPFDPR